MMFATRHRLARARRRARVATSCDGLRQLGPPRVRLDHPVDRVAHLADELLVPGDQEGQPVRSVLGLDDEIYRSPLERSASVCDHHDLRGPGERGRDTDGSGDLALRLGHVAVPRPHDDVDARDALGSECHRCDGLGTPDGVNLVYSGHRGRREDRGRRIPSWPGGRTGRALSTPATVAGAAHMSTLDG